MQYPDLPIRALSVMQPWSFLIVNGHKDIENRDWPTKYRGLVAIHAGKTIDASAADDLYNGYHPVTGMDIGFRVKPTDLIRGGIVGFATITGCVERSESDWFVGRYGFLIRDAMPVPFIPLKGALGFFDWRKNL